MLQAIDITKSFGTNLVLDRVSLAVHARTRTGIVGPNGVGKTTLLRILAGRERADDGRVERSPLHLAVGYLPQEVEPRPGETVRGYLARRTGVAAASDELDRLTTAMAQTPVPSEGRSEPDGLARSEGRSEPDGLARLEGPSGLGATVEAYTEALERYMALGGDDLDVRIAHVAADVGLREDRLDLQMGDLSGGQSAKAALAAILLSRFDVFLLDEPTNNLDFAGLDRLESFLTGLPGGVVVISHDRAFLDRTVTRVLEIEEESHHGREYAGGWSDYVASRELARTQQLEAFERFQSEKKRLTERMREQRSWAESGARKERKNPRDGDKAQRDFRINRTEKQASKVRITEKRMANLETADKPWAGWQLHLLFMPDARSGDVVARLDRAVVRRGSFTLGPVDLEIAWQDRLAIVGPNGGGKTTLLRALLGELALDGGHRYLGPGVKVGQMDQGRGAYAGDESLVDAFMARTGLTRVGEARSLLAKFGLTATHVQRAGRRLSPGERSRAVLATLMAQGVNCLILDEPTNHLDLAAIEELERALDSYEGTLLLVTHDRRLLEAVTVTRTITVDDGNVSGHE